MARGADGGLSGCGKSTIARQAGRLAAAEPAGGRRSSMLSGPPVDQTDHAVARPSASPSPPAWRCRISARPASNFERSWPASWLSNGR